MNADKKILLKRRSCKTKRSRTFTNDDFDFMSVNSDSTDLEILESRWKVRSVRDGNETGTGFIRVRES